MRRELLIALRTALVTLLVTGVAYPLVVTALSQLLFPDEARGSLVSGPRGATAGSSLIGQPFRRAAYFHGRPSAAGPDGYDAASSSGSNLATSSARLQERMRGERARLLEENPGAVGPPPRDLLTASASGLDPHISPEAARWQAPRVAAARGIDPRRVEEAVAAVVEGRWLGFGGEPRVNVLLLDLELDRRFGPPPP